MRVLVEEVSVVGRGNTRSEFFECRKDGHSEIVTLPSRLSASGLELCYLGVDRGVLVLKGNNVGGARACRRSMGLRETMQGLRGVSVVVGGLRGGEVVAVGNAGLRKPLRLAVSVSCGGRSLV